MTMQMQIETRTADPTEDHKAFIGSVLACFLVLTGLITADILFSSDTSPHHLTQDGRQQAPVARADPS